MSEEKATLRFLWGTKLGGTIGSVSASGLLRGIGSWGPDESEDTLEKDALLRQCRAALDAVLERKPMMGAMYYACGSFTGTIGNLRAELGKFPCNVSN